MVHRVQPNLPASIDMRAFDRIELCGGEDVCAESRSSHAASGRVFHPAEVARRAGVDLGLRDFDEASRGTPVIADVRPSGRFLMEDFYYAGGLPAVMRAISDKLHLDALTVNGRTVGENVANAMTPGYTRQGVLLASVQPLQSGTLSAGAGVTVTPFADQGRLTPASPLRPAPIAFANAFTASDCGYLFQA